MDVAQPRTKHAYLQYTKNTACVLVRGTVSWDSLRHPPSADSLLISNSTVEPPPGVEPGTYRLQGGCSDQLS